MMNVCKFLNRSTKCSTLTLTCIKKKKNKKSKEKVRLLNHGDWHEMQHTGKKKKNPITILTAQAGPLSCRGHGITKLRDDSAPYL